MRGRNRDVQVVQEQHQTELWKLAAFMGAAGFCAVLFAGFVWSILPGVGSGHGQAPALVGEAVDGRTIDLASMQGQPALVVFWATWCGACRHHMPEVDEVYEDNRDLVVIGVSADHSPQKVRRYLDNHDMRFPVMMGDRATLSAWNVRAFPTTYVIDEDGQIVERFVGSRRSDRLLAGL